MNNIKKEVNFYDRVLYFLLAVSIASLFALYSFNPLVARAYGEPDPASIIQRAWDYGQNYIHNMEVVESAFKHDLDSGNIDATSDLARQIACATLYQKLLNLGNHDLIIQEANSTLFFQQFQENCRSGLS